MDAFSGHHRAAAATRASARFTLAFGPISVAVAAYPAVAPAERPRRHEFTADASPIGRLRVDKTDGGVVDPKQVVKRATASDGTQVVLSDDELAALVPTGEAVPVEWLVPLGPLWDGTYCVHSTYYLRQRQGGGRGTAVARHDALAAVLEALRAENAGALLRPVVSGRVPRWCALVPDGRLLALCFANEVRPAPHVGVASVGAVSEARSAARQIGTGVPVLSDRVGARVQRYLDNKAREVLQPEVIPPRVASITDIGPRVGAPAETSRGLRRRRPWR